MCFVFAPVLVRIIQKKFALGICAGGGDLRLAVAFTAFHSAIVQDQLEIICNVRINNLPWDEEVQPGINNFAELMSERERC